MLFFSLSLVLFCFIWICSVVSCLTLSYYYVAISSYNLLSEVGGRRPSLHGAGVVPPTSLRKVTELSCALFTDMYHTCVSYVYPACIICVSCIYPTCGLCVYCMYHTCILHASYVYPKRIICVSCMYHICILDVSDMYAMCILFVSIVKPTCILCVSCMYLVCILCVS